MGKQPLAALASRLPPQMVDASLALALAGALVGVRAIEAHGLQRAGWLGYALAVVAALLLTGRRQWPLAVFAGTLALALISVTLASPTGAISIPVVISIYTLAQVEAKRSAVLLASARRGRLGARARPCCNTGAGPTRGRQSSRRWHWRRYSSAGPSRSHRAYIAEIEARAVQAERTREDEARRRVDAERLRIARELHDVLAHGIATINVQAGVAAHVLHEHPEHAAQALQTIKQTSKDALRELRDVLGVLREAGRVRATRAHARAKPARAPDRRHQPRGSTHASDDLRAAPGAACHGRPRRIPHRAGVAHQRPSPRRTDRAPWSRSPSTPRG